MEADAWLSAAQGFRTRGDGLVSLFLFRTQSRGNSPRVPTWSHGLRRASPCGAARPRCRGRWVPPSPCSAFSRPVSYPGFSLDLAPGTPASEAQMVPSPRGRRSPRGRASTEAHGLPQPQQAPLPLGAGSQPTGRWQPHRTAIPSRALPPATAHCSLLNGGFLSLPLTKTGSSGSRAVEITCEAAALTCQGRMPGDTPPDGGWSYSRSKKSFLNDGLHFVK